MHPNEVYGSKHSPAVIPSSNTKTSNTGYNKPTSGVKKIPGSSPKGGKSTLNPPPKTYTKSNIPAKSPARTTPKTSNTKPTTSKPTSSNTKIPSKPSTSKSTTKESQLKPSKANTSHSKPAESKKVPIQSLISYRKKRKSLD